MPKDAPHPVYLPDKVWRRADVLGLCRDQDADGLFRLARKHGFTNESIGYWTGIDPAEISKRINGTKGPVRALDRWQRIADGLNMPDGARLAVGLSPRAGRLELQDPAPQPTPIDDGALAARLDRARQGIESMIEPASPGAAVDDLEASVDQAARDALTAPPAVVLAALLTDFEIAQDFLRSDLPQWTRSRVVRAAGSAATLIGEELMILGRTSQSHQWFTAADRLCAAVSDRTGRGWAATLQSRLPLYFGDVAEAVELARRAQELAPTSTPVAESLGSMVEALALAQLGDKDSSLDALSGARDAFESARPESTHETVFTFSRRRFLFYESRVLLDNARYADAWTAQDEALALYGLDGNGDVTVLQLDRARLLVRKGELSGGCAHAVDTLTRLPAEERTSLYVSRGRRVLAAVPRTERHSLAATGLRETLRDLSARA